MSKREFLGAWEAEKLTKQKWKQYCGVPYTYLATMGGQDREDDPITLLSKTGVPVQAVKALVPPMQVVPVIISKVIFRELVLQPIYFELSILHPAHSNKLES